MSQSLARRSPASEFLRNLPAMLGALLAVVVVVDVVIVCQPTWLDELSHTLRSVISVRPVLTPYVNMLSASLTVGSVVLASALLLGFSRAVSVAPHVSLAPAWVALCLLSVVRVQAQLPLPMSMPLFAALSALLFVGASTALCSGSRVGSALGWLLVVAPIAVFCLGYTAAPSGALPFQRDAALVLSGLCASLVGVVLLSLMHNRSRASREVPGLEGVDVVDALFAQVERAERAEARAAELERQLSAHMRPQQTGEHRALRRVR
jgi:hypothetical protein